MAMPPRRGKAIAYDLSGAAPRSYLPLKRSMTLDSLGFARIDLIKIDIEGMEIEAIEGAVGLLARAHPVLIVESIKSDKAKLREILETLGYRLFDIGMNLLAIHESDKTASHMKSA